MQHLDLPKSFEDQLAFRTHHLFNSYIVQLLKTTLSAPVIIYGQDVRGNIIIGWLLYNVDAMLTRTLLLFSSWENETLSTELVRIEPVSNSMATPTSKVSSAWWTERAARLQSLRLSARRGYYSRILRTLQTWLLRTLNSASCSRTLFDHLLQPSGFPKSTTSSQIFCNSTATQNTAFSNFLSNMGVTKNIICLQNAAVLDLRSDRLKNESRCIFRNWKTRFFW